MTAVVLVDHQHMRSHRILVLSLVIGVGDGATQGHQERAG